MDEVRYGSLLCCETKVVTFLIQTGIFFYLNGGKKTRVQKSVLLRKTKKNYLDMRQTTTEIAPMIKLLRRLVFWSIYLIPFVRKSSFYSMAFAKKLSTRYLMEVLDF